MLGIVGQISMVVFVFVINSNAVFGQDIENAKYLQQNPPGMTPKLFAPGIIFSPNEYEFGSVFSKKADEFYYAVKLNDDWKAEIRFVEWKDGKWTKPVTLDLDAAYGYNDPFLSENGNRLYFMSNKPKKAATKGGSSNLWYVEKEGNGWSNPINLGDVVNSEKNEYYVSFTDNGTLYFASNAHTTAENEGDHDIYYATQTNGKFNPPIRMGAAVNNEHFDVDPFVAPDGSYLIFCSTRRDDGYGQGDLYISFKKADSTWSQAKNMGAPINTDGHEFCPFVTKDGKYLFYTSAGDIYWVSSGIIENFRKQN